jgi:hypothetical protein
MTKEFTPYDRSLKLKAIGFDEPCFGYYLQNKRFISYEERRSMPKQTKDAISAPLFQQAFRWFREEYKFHAEIRSYTAKYFTIIIQELKDIVRYLEYGGIDLKFNTYEEAELACLDKLIEIVETKQQVQ